MPHKSTYTRPRNRSPHHVLTWRDILTDIWCATGWTLKQVSIVTGVSTVTMSKVVTGWFEQNTVTGRYNPILRTIRRIRLAAHAYRDELIKYRKHSMDRRPVVSIQQRDGLFNGKRPRIYRVTRSSTRVYKRLHRPKQLGPPKRPEDCAALGGLVWFCRTLGLHHGYGHRCNRDNWNIPGEARVYYTEVVESWSHVEVHRCSTPRRSDDGRRVERGLD